MSTDTPAEIADRSKVVLPAAVKARVTVGEPIITAHGHALVTAITALGVSLSYVDGSARIVRFDDLSLRAAPDGEVASIEIGLAPWWAAMRPVHRRVVVFRLEVVQEILTGYRRGLPQLAEPGEPRAPYGPDSKESLNEQCAAMASWLSLEREADRDRARAFRPAKPVGASTIKRWVRRFQDQGLLGLDDARRARATDGYPTVPAEFKAAARELAQAIDGDLSTITQRGFHLRVLALLRDRGIHPEVPKRRTAEFLSALLSERGRTTRGHRSHLQRKRSGSQAYPAIFPGQLVSIDATRADVIVYDPVSNGPVSVEIITAIDVATRMVLAVRVVPKSANSLDASLLLYDVLRPFTLTVHGETAGEWRWVGVPGAVDLTAFARGTRIPVLHAGDTLQGDHHVPGVLPVGVRTDHGSVFAGVVFSELLRRLGIDQVPSRVGRPMDNNAVERLHDTYRRCLERVAGYKGRNSTERGRKAGTEKPGGEQLLTAQFLERHLRSWVAIDYNATPHTGLRIPGVTERDVAPVELFDVLQQRAGAITVPQRPEMLYDFLPVRMLKVSKGSVEFRQLTYYCPDLASLRYTSDGDPRRDTRHPFYYDPRDRTRIWFKHPDTGVIVEVLWRKAHLVHAPFADSIARELLRRIRDRPTYVRDIESRIVTELGALTSPAEVSEVRAQLAAASIRFSSAKRDHDEASTAQASRATLRALPPPRPPAPELDVVDIWTDEWPDLTGDD